MTRTGALFAGYGGLELGVQAALGGEVAWHSEIDPDASRILAHHWPDVPNVGDVTAVDWSRVEPVDIITGGSPCQDVSSAGKRQGMRAGTRSGLWASMVDAIDVLRPRLVVWENVRGVTSACAHSELEPCPGCVGGTGPHRPVLRALGRVLGDLADVGYDAQWHGLRAADIGAPHGRFRIFVVAFPAGDATGRHGQSQVSGGLRQKPRQVPPRGSDRHSAADASDIGQEWSRPARDRWPGPADGAESSALRRQQCSRQRPHAAHQWISGDFAGPVWCVGIAADSDLARSQGSESARRRHLPDGRTAADTSGDPRRISDRDRGAAADTKVAERRTEEPEHLGAVVGSASEFGERAGETAWGQYEHAIRRWERALGRVAPAPTELGAKGGQRLSPRFVEWMQGLPEGHVTDPAIGISRNAQLKALGNGVVPQQAAAAVTYLLAIASERAA